MDEVTGLLQLTVTRKKGSVIKDAYAKGAFKLSRPLEADSSGQLLLYLMNPGGGYVDGDRYKVVITLEAGSELAFTTQSATKIYKTLRGEVRSVTEVNLGEGAMLEMLPDPIIAYENAVYVQETVLRLQPGASLVLLDAWTPGWSPSGKYFTYNRIDSLTELYVGNELQVADRMMISPSDRLPGLGELEGYSHYGSLLVVHVKGTEDETNKLHAYLLRLIDSESIRFGVTNLEIPGFLLRIMACSTEDLLRVARVCHDYVRVHWLGKTPIHIRKY